ncbi:hypothetical protein CsSME_00037353 [Camellia sinensis var. sinensis]
MEENLSGYIFQIHDKFLQTHLQNESCDVFKNLSFPNPSISFTFSPHLTFFKCNNNFHTVSPKEDHFTDFHNYTNCEDYNLYYKYPDDDLLSFPAPLPPSCSVIQLPVNSSNTNPNVNEPFNLLTNTFSLVLHVSEGCQECYKGGGQCQNDNQKFHCATNEGIIDIITN